MPTLPRKNRNPFGKDEVVRATRPSPGQAAPSAPARGTAAVIPSWRRTGAPSFPARLWIRSWRIRGPSCRRRPSTHRRYRCGVPRSQSTGRCAAWWIPRFRCNGRRIALAQGVGRRRHSFAVSFGRARSSMFSTNKSAGIRSGSAGSSVTSRLRTSSAWNAASARGVNMAKKRPTTVVNQPPVTIVKPPPIKLVPVPPRKKRK